MTQQPAPQQPPLFTLQIIWGALLFSSFSYFIVLKIREQHLEDWSVVPGNPLFLPLVMMAILCLIASVMIPKLMLKNVKLSAPNDLKEAAAKYTVPFIISLALTESISIYGLLLAMQLGMEIFFPFVGVAILRFLTAFPSKNSVLAKFNNF